MDGLPARRILRRVRAHYQSPDPGVLGDSTTVRKGLIASQRRWIRLCDVLLILL